MLQKIVDKVIDIAFEQPKYPMRFRELMEANKTLVDNLDVKLIPGIKFCRWKLYGLYFLFWNLLLIPLSLVLHPFLKHLDCHLAIVLAILFTLLFFGTYKIFEERIKKEVAKRIIMQAWQKYLPHFDYERYHEEVAQIYKEALDKDIPKKEMERFVIDRLIK